MAFQCDRYVRPPLHCYHRAIEIKAPKEIVYRWLCQLRVAPYSYDLIDNRGRRSPRELTPGAEQLAAGQRFMMVFEIVEFEPSDHITMRLSRGKPFFGDVALTYRLIPHGPAYCRVVIKMSAFREPGLLGYLRKFLFPWGELMMMRKQLLTFKGLAETQFLEQLAQARSAEEPAMTGAESEPHGTTG